MSCFSITTVQQWLQLWSLRPKRTFTLTLLLSTPDIDGRCHPFWQMTLKSTECKFLKSVAFANAKDGYLVMEEWWKREILNGWRGRRKKKSLKWIACVYKPWIQRQPHAGQSGINSAVNITLITGVLVLRWHFLFRRGKIINELTPCSLYWIPALSHLKVRERKRASYRKKENNLKSSYQRFAKWKYAITFLVLRFVYTNSAFTVC